MQERTARAAAANKPLTTNHENNLIAKITRKGLNTRKLGMEYRQI